MGPGIGTLIVVVSVIVVVAVAVVVAVVVEMAVVVAVAVVTSVAVVIEMLVPILVFVWVAVTVTGILLPPPPPGLLFNLCWTPAYSPMKMELISRNNIATMHKNLDKGVRGSCANEVTRSPRDDCVGCAPFASG